MEKLADKLRKENKESFGSIKDELTTIVVERIKKYGDCEVHTYKSCKGVEVDSYYGIFVDSSFRYSVKEHFKALGFVVTETFIGYGSSHCGWMIQL